MLIRAASRTATCCCAHSSLPQVTIKLPLAKDAVNVNDDLNRRFSFKGLLQGKTPIWVSILHEGELAIY